MITHQGDVVLFPEKVLVWFGVFELHMAHVDVHQGRSGKKVLRFAGNDSDFVRRALPQKTGCRDPGHSISDDDYMHTAWVKEICCGMGTTVIYI